MKKDEKGIYIHIPFCKQKCFYCDFISFSNIDYTISTYVECLKKEIRNSAQRQQNISTIYIGGGTPSYIDGKYVKEILEELNIDSNKQEITIEVNPGTVTQDKLKMYKDAGINRLSIGLQTTNNVLLKKIGRIHNFEEFCNTYNLARKIGFNNINIDLMLGLPEQTILDLKDSLEKVISFNPEHISIYSLILEENTKLYDEVKSNNIKLPDEDIERQMYWYVKNTLELNGYNHYEISNFSKKGYESKHNLNCWKQKEYMGFGLSASSYINGVRYRNITSIKKYIQNIQNEDYDSNKVIEEVQKEEDKQKEFIMLGLRLIKGVSIRDFKNKFGKNPIYLFKNEFNKLVNENLLQIDGDEIKLTSKGLDLANQVWTEFI